MRDIAVDTSGTSKSTPDLGSICDKRRQIETSGDFVEGLSDFAFGATLNRGLSFGAQTAKNHGAF